MTSEMANIIYQRYRELVLENPKHGFGIEQCENCGMNHGTVVGEGLIEPAPTIVLASGGPVSNPFTLQCQLCSGEMEKIGEEDVLRWMDVIGSVLMYADLASLGIYAS